MPDCIFCKIVKKEIPCYKIYEDKDFLAFLDIFPKTEGHCLVVPKKHIQWVWDYPELGKYFEVVGKIARHFREVTGEKIIRSIVLGWEVPHAHVHLFPGQENNLQAKKLSVEEMEKIRQKFSL